MNRKSGRSFRMGFSPWPYAMTADAVAETNRFVTSHGDILSEQLDDSIPWEQAARGEPYPDAYVQQMRERRDRLGAGQQRLLYMTPFNMERNGLLAHYQAPGTAPNTGWTRRRFHEPTVIQAYTHHVVWMIRFFQPDYLITAIESNEYLKNAPDQWPHYVTFSERVRKRVKQLFPRLPLSESISLHNLLDPNIPGNPERWPRIQAFVKPFDFVAVSYYPLLLGHKRADEIERVLVKLRSLTNKPLAFAETGQPAETLELPAHQLVFPLTPADQSAAMQTLFDFANREQCLFLIWWCHRDYDALWETFPADVKDLGRIWRDLGVLDETGARRDGYHLWERMRQAPLTRSSR